MHVQARACVRACVCVCLAGAGFDNGISRLDYSCPPPISFRSPSLSRNVPVNALMRCAMTKRERKRERELSCVSK
jgi:hypothetical protein